MCATRAAIEEGIVPGGGVTYIRAIDALEGMKGDNADETTGIEIIKRAIEEPLRQIVANAGKEGAVVVQKYVKVKVISDTMHVQMFTNTCMQPVL